jgi:hypothetical protein
LTIHEKRCIIISETRTQGKAQDPRPPQQGQEDTMKKMTTEQLYTYVNLLDNLDVLDTLDQGEKKKALENAENIKGEAVESIAEFFPECEDTIYTARLHEIADELDAFREEHREELNALCEMLGAYRKEDGHWYIKRRKLMVNGDEEIAFFHNFEEDFILDDELKKMKF